MSDMECWVIPEYVVCHHLRDRFAAIAAETPPVTIQGIFEYNLPLGDEPSYVNVREWFDKLDFTIDVGDPTIFAHFPRMVVHWAEESEKRFVGGVVDEENDVLSIPGLSHTYGSEFTGRILCSIQGLGPIECVWMYQIVLRLLLGAGAHQLEDLGVRVTAGIESKDLEWLSAKGDGATARGRMLMIPCTYSRFFRDIENVAPLSQVLDVQSSFYPQDQPLP